MPLGDAMHRDTDMIILLLPRFKVLGALPPLSVSIYSVFPYG